MSLPRPPTLDEVCTEALRLPCSPALLPRLMVVLQDSNHGTDEIGAVIELDQALAAATLRTANSVALGGAEPVETVAEAVLRLGQREVFRLAALASVHRWENGTASEAYGGGPGDFSRHALCTAIAAGALAERSARIDPAIAYTAGLVCELGKLAVARTAAAFFPTIRARREATGGPWLMAEREVLGYDHAQVSAHLLRGWRFPTSLVVAAEFWPRPGDAPAEAQPLLAIVHAAKYLATALGVGVAEDGFLFELQSEFLLAWGFSPELLETMLPVVCERTAQVLREKLTHGAIA